MIFSVGGGGESYPNIRARRPANNRGSLKKFTSKIPKPSRKSRRITDKQVTTQPRREPNPISETEYVIDKIVSNSINEDPEHPTAEVGEMTFQVRWYGYDADEDTFEPVRHLPRNKIVSYCRRKKMALPPNINEAESG